MVGAFGANKQCNVPGAGSRSHGNLTLLPGTQPEPRVAHELRHPLFFPLDFFQGCTMHRSRLVPVLVLASLGSARRSLRRCDGRDLPASYLRLDRSADPPRRRPVRRGAGHPAVADKGPHRPRGRALSRRSRGEPARPSSRGCPEDDRKGRCSTRQSAAFRTLLIDRPELVRVRLELARAFFLRGRDFARPPELRAGPCRGPPPARRRQRAALSHPDPGPQALAGLLRSGACPGQQHRGRVGRAVHQHPHRRALLFRSAATRRS